MKYDEILEEVKSLNKDFLNLLIIDLISSGKLSFVEFANFYTSVLEKHFKTKSASIESLGLMLGVYCMNDATEFGKTAREHLFESGMYTEKDGSKFGETLFTEFKDKDDFYKKEPFCV